MAVKRFHRATGGAAGVEFALIGPLFVIALMGMYDFGRLFWIQNALEFAAEQTGRFVMANPTSSLATLQAHCNGILTGMTGINCQAPVKTTLTSSAGNTVEYWNITAEYVFHFSVWCPAGVCGTISLSTTSQAPAINGPGSNPAP